MAQKELTETPDQKIDESDSVEEAEELDDDKTDDAYEAEKDGSEEAEDSDESEDDHDEETEEALEELESQELQPLEEEVSEALLVDEVAELRAMRREELTMNVDAQVQKSGEFVCQNCFMVKRTSQLANKRKMICQDCVA